MGVPSSYLLWSSSICLPLVLLVHASAQVHRTGTQVSEGRHRREQWREAQGQSLVSRAWSSQREQCQGWQSWIFPGRTWVLPGPLHLTSEMLSICLSLMPGMLESVKPILHSRWRTQVSCLPDLLFGVPPTPRAWSCPTFPLSSCFLTNSLNACLAWHPFCSLEAAYSPVSEVQASLKLLTRIGGDCLFSVLIRNWLMPMEAANSDTTYCPFSPRPFLVWSCLAPSMLCSWHPALWLQPPLGTDVVKAS